MATMTIRGLDDSTVKALRRRAERDGTSVNTVTVRLLQESLGIRKKKRTVQYDDLDHLAGTWSEKDYREFQKNIADFETIDPAMWK
ncbi:MAG TPA: hypothetical protein VK445_10555 [Dissulfurispiraceae bacterium]|nr:hypothetical protein [Dissulfurispiraceae bacterium]